MKSNSKIVLLAASLLLLTGCFSARKYMGASRRDNHDGSITYTFKSRDYRRGASINVDQWRQVQMNVDSCLTDDYIRKFFKLENGRIIPKYDNIRNPYKPISNPTWDELEEISMAYRRIVVDYITNSKFVTWDGKQEVWYSQNLGGTTSAAVNGDGTDALIFEKIVDYDDNGNIEKITYGRLYEPLSGSKCLFDNGTGYYVDADFLEIVDTLNLNVNAVQLPRPVAGYDENGYFFLNHRRKLNDSVTVVTRIQAYATEEGRVENNYKVGEWKYRDSAGELVRTEHYRLRDKVDVRFPYRYFNKRRFRQ